MKTKDNLFTLLFLSIVLMLTACHEENKVLMERAEELLEHRPLRGPLEKEYLTTDFYAILDTLCSLPLYESQGTWYKSFDLKNGYRSYQAEVAKVEQTDKTHAVATIKVTGIRNNEPETREHNMDMQLVDGQWLMADFDGRKAGCSRIIARIRRAVAFRGAICNYLTREIGSHYQQGEVCIPVIIDVCKKEDENTQVTHLWGDFWVYWYNMSGDTLKCVSGGNHPGLMILQETADGFKVTSFEQVEDGSSFLPSARRIFGEYFEDFQAVQSNDDKHKYARREQLRDYIKQYRLNVHYYQDYGWPAESLRPDRRERPMN